MFLGILPFLIQWIALSQLGNNQYASHEFQQTQISYRSTKNHWTLLTELSKLPEEDIEQYLPQICNIVLDREALNNEELFNYFENIIVNKCADCVPFGLKVCGLLKSSASSPVEGLFRNVLLSSTSSLYAARKEERFSSFQDRVEYVTRHGHDHHHHPHGASTPSGAMRARYVGDYTFLLDSLGRLGVELRAYPVSHRNFHLRKAMVQCNSLLNTRMVSLGHTTPEGVATPHYSGEGQRITTQDIARRCPDIARYSLHLPLQRSRERIRRVVRFVESDCEVLPSRDRSPFLVVVETVEERARCRHPSLYTHEQFAGEDVDAAMNGENEVEEECDVDADTSNDGNDSTSEFDQLKGGENDITRLLRGGSDRKTTAAGFHHSTPQTHPLNALPSPRHRRRPHKLTSEPRALSEVARDVSKHSQQTQDERGDASWSGADDRVSAIATGGVSSVASVNHQAVVSSVELLTDQTSITGNNHASLNTNTVSSTSQDINANHIIVTSGSLVPVTTGTLNPTNSPQNSLLSRKASLRASSPFGHLPTWDVSSFVVKSGDDVRKETLAMQLIAYMQRVFRDEQVDIFLRPYQIVSTGRQSGLIEYLEGTQSIDRIKKGSAQGSGGVESGPVGMSTTGGGSAVHTTLRDHFESTFGPAYSPIHNQAVQNFARSLAGYSLVTYLLQVKDRHNGNILLDSEGHIIHIDYGFILGDSPGFNINFESAPFKLTREYVTLLGGVDSAAFRLFEDLFVRGFLALQRHAEGMSAVIQLFYGDKRKGAAEQMCSRLLFLASHGDILGLVRDSLDNWRTKQYDWFQQQSNNILM